MNRHDIDHMSDLRAAMTRRPSFMANLLLFAIIAFFGIALLWADVAEIDQVSVGEGRVMPSRHIQIVQNLEGGIVAELNMRAGDIVKKDQVLMLLDDTQFSSELLENRMKFFGLQATMARLQGEIAGTALRFPEKVATQFPAFVRGERELHASRANELQSALARLQFQHRRKSVV